MEPETLFRRLLVKLSDYFGTKECQKLCHHFNLQPAKQSSILEAESSGLTLLEQLAHDDIITPGDLTKLKKALEYMQIAAPALKNIEEYHKEHGIMENEIHYELDDSDTEDEDNSCDSSATGTFDEFLVRVGLDGKIANKLSLDDFMQIMDPSSSSSTTYPQMFWQKLTSFDYRACLPDTSIAKERFSTRDFIYAMIQCSDNFLRQDIITKMALCHMAVPILLPDVSKGKVQFLVWALRGIMKHRGADLEQYIVYYPTFTVSVLRIGNVRLSKSNFLNTLTGRCQGNAAHAHFLTQNDDFVTPLFSKGSVEAMWYLPTNSQQEKLKDVTTFLNLRGNCAEYERQVEFACRAANLVIAFVAKENRNEYNTFFGKIKSWSKDVMFVAIREQDASSPDKEARRIKRKGEWSFVNTLQMDVLCNYVSNEIVEYCKKCTESERLTLVNNVELCSALNIEVDQEEKSCREVETVVEEVLGNVRGENLSDFKQSTFALQEGWREWVTIDKKPLAIDRDEEHSLEHLKEKAACEKQKKRKRQLEVGLSEDMKIFRRALQEFYHKKEISKDNLRYFMFSFQQILKRETDKGVAPHIRNIITLRDKLQAVGSTSSPTKKLSPLMKKERVHESGISQMLKQSCLKESELYRQKNLGCEHFIRELGQYFEAVVECDDDTFVDADTVLLPEIGAYLLYQGMPLEIMDGDTGRVPITWVSNVFRELKEMLNDETIFVLGIIGVQSSGKSTLLNSMFGAGFSVRAGRCTSGIYLRVLEVEKDFSHKLGFRYIFLVDSEGLCSPERAQPDVLEQLFDNQLATFMLCITDVTILNFEGENISPSMRGILQIATYAHMRMKNAKLKTQCRITQQKVGQADAPLRNKANITQIIETLDTATHAASQAEGFGDMYKEFSDIFYLHLDDKTQYIPSLWNGTMMPPNHLYSEAVVTLRDAILNDFICNAIQPQFKISDFLQRMENVWDAVKEETFVFNYQDTFRAIAFHRLSLVYARLIVEMRGHMIQLRHECQQLIEDSTQNLHEVHEKVKEHVTVEFKSQHEIIIKKLKAQVESDHQQHNLKLFHNRFVEQSKFDIKEAEMYMLLDVQNDLKAKERQSEIQNTVSTWRRSLQEKAFALKNRDNKYTLVELQSMFHIQWEQWMKTVRETFTLRGVSGNRIQNIFLEKLLKTTAGTSVEKEVSSLLKNENGIDADKKDIVWREEFPDHFTGEDGKKVEIITEMVSQILHELHQQCQRRGKFDENLVHFTVQNAFHKLSSFETESSLKDEDTAMTMGTFILPSAAVAKALFHVCCKACTIIQETHQKYEEEFSCDRLFEEYRDSLMGDFTAFYESKFQDERAVTFAFNLLLNIATRHIVGFLSLAFRKTLLEMYNLPTKCEFINEILHDISTRDDPTSYLKFIADPSSFIESWLFERCKLICVGEENNRNIHNLAQNRLFQITESILSALKVAKSSTTNCRKENLIYQWVAVFEKQVEKETGVKCRLIDLIRFQILDIKDFTDRLTDLVESKLKEKVLEKLQLPFPGDSTEVENFLTLVLDNPAKEASRQFIWCRKQCPLCGSPCDQLPVLGHRHSATVHYPLGISGKCNSNSSRLAVDFCSNALLCQNFSYKMPGSKEVFNTANFERDYPDWFINPIGNLYQNDYWKWVYVKYNNDFARHYNCKPASLPKSWTKITKESALQSLNYEMSIVIRRQRILTRTNTTQNIRPTSQIKGTKNSKVGSGRRR